jgi:hypothetical protein
VSLLALLALLAANNVSSVRVEMSHSGWGDKTSTLTLQRFGNSYYTGDSVRIPTSAVEALLAAVEAPPVRELVPGSFHVDLDKLRAQLIWTAKMQRYPPQMANRFLEAGMKNVSDLVRRVNLQTWTDDYPSAAIEIALASGARISLSSTVQSAFMLPWRIENGSSSFETFNPDVSRALAAVLPAGFLNRDRIAGEGFDKQVDEEAMFFALSGRFSAEEDLGDQLAPIKARFTVVNASVGVIDSFNAESVYAWSAVVDSREVERVQYDLELTVRERDRALADTKPFLRDAGPLARKVLSIPWIQRRMATNASAKVSIRYFDSRSIGSKPRKQYLAKGGIPPALFQRSIAFGLEGAVWILLPDGRCLLAAREATVDGVAVHPEQIVDREGHLTR